MGSNSAKAFGAAGRDDLLWFEDDQVIIVEDPGNPLYDKDAIDKPLDEALILNIMARGILEPIIVRKNGERRGKPIVEVVDGRQRVKNVREANRRLAAQGAEKLRIPAIRKRGTDADMFAIMVGTFIRRTEQPIERAKKIVRYLNMGKSDQEAAVAFGLKVQVIRASVQLLECAQEVQDAVDRKEVPSVIALKLSKLPREDQVTALAELKKEGATRGTKGVRAADEKIGRTPKPKLRSRKQIEQLIDVFECSAEKLPDPRAVLKYVLGDDRALSEKWHPGG